MFSMKMNFWFYLLVLLFLAGIGALLADFIAGYLFLKKGRNTAKRVMREKPIREYYAEISKKPLFCRYEEIPASLTVILVNLEDKTFWEHKGVNVVKIIQSLIENMQKWEKSRGGSTITQQLAKNMYFSFEKTIHRKIAEYFVAKELERTLTKQEILEFYLNIVTWGDGIKGVGEASEFYFRKSPSELTVNQSLALVTMLPNPKYFSVFNPESAYLKGKRNALNVLSSRKLFQPEDIEFFLTSENCEDFRNEISDRYEELYRKHRR